MRSIVSSGPQRWRVAFGLGVLAALVLFASLPGLLGGWVGDDFHMISSRLYGDWAEIPRVFARHAGHYLDSVDDAESTWPYRPVTMFTLLLPHVLLPQPWLHHLVGWLIHVATGGLLLVALLRQTPPQVHPSARAASLVLVALFLLHPVTVEAYVFINGRSDLVAGLCLASLAALLLDPRLGRLSGFGLVGLVTFLGAASKATFVPAAMALWLGLTLRSEHRRKNLNAAIPIGLAVVAYVGLRAANVPFVGRVGATQNLIRDWSAFADVPQLLGKSIAAILTFRAEAMQSLAWQLLQPFSALEWIGILSLVFAAAGLAFRRDIGGLVLLGGVVGTIAPCVIVSRAIWLGFDRYLYLPLVLALIAGSPYVVAAIEAWPRRALWWSLAGVLVLVSVLGTRASSLAYASQGAYERAVRADHPDDPTVVFYLARAAKKSGQLALARDTLSKIHEPPWPVALIVPAFLLASELSEPRSRDMAIDCGVGYRGQNAVIRAYGMRWSYERGDVPGALARASSIGPQDAVCPEVRRQLELWADATDGEPQRAQLHETALQLRCASP